MAGQARRRKIHPLVEETAAPDITFNENRAAEILSAGQIEDALMQILEGGIEPLSPAARRMLAMCHMRAKRMDKARVIIDAENRRTPGEPFLLKMLGDWHFLVSDFPKAEYFYERALEKVPDHPDITHDRAVAIASQGRIEDALVGFRKSCTLNPEKADFKHHLAIMLVLAGHEAEGWPLMEARLGVPGVTGNFPRPEAYWKGEPLEGKTIVLRSEQGFGDTFMCLRYLKPIQDMKPAKIYAYCQPEMVTFVDEYCPGVISWQNKAPPPLDFDYHINLMSLPALFPDNRYTVPAVQPTGDAIGVSWFGSPTHKADHLRTVPFERFLPLLDARSDLRWLCAQYGFFQQKPPKVEYFVERCRDWKESAQQFQKELRLLISVDTASAHLAGFLGIPCWLLLPYVPDFRWGMTGEQSWYESVRVYRQTKLMEWGDVFERVMEDLKAL